MNTSDEIRSLWKAIADLNMRLSGARRSAISTFIGLTDTPASYAGSAKKIARVNAAVTALEFGADISDLDNVDSLAGQALKYARVKALDAGIEFVAAGAGTFIGLTDTPGAFEYGHVWGNIAKNALLFSGNKHPDIPPTAPETEDDEFNNEAIDVKWTITNDPAGGNAMDESKYPGNIWVGLIEHVAADNFDSLIRFHQTPPAGNQTLEFQAKISFVGHNCPGNINEWSTIGVYFGNSAQDQHISAEVQFNDSWAAQYGMRVNGGEDNGAGGMSGMANVKQQQVIPSEWIYLKIVKTTANAYNAGNTYKAYFSLNGLIWYEMGYDNKTFTTNCDEIGIYFRRPKNQAGTAYCEAIVDWFRRMD